MASVDTKFAEMPEGERKRWVVWANSHDWAACRDPRYDSETAEFVTASQECDANGVWSVVEARHKTPRDLRNWAGY